MIKKDEPPIEAVGPTNEQRTFLKRIVPETTEHARSKNYNDMYFQGHRNKGYFGAYSTKIIRRGAGRSIFSLDRQGGVVHFAFPDKVVEPRTLSKPWEADLTRNRTNIGLEKAPSEEIQLYLIGLAKRS